MTEKQIVCFQSNNVKIYSLNFWDFQVFEVTLVSSDDHANKRIAPGKCSDTYICCFLYENMEKRKKVRNMRNHVKATK
jgi:hypothetical protein